MNSDTPLDTIWESYQVMRDCLKIVQRSLIKKDMYLLSKTAFLTNSEEQAMEQIKKGRCDANDYVILSLWAAFERIIIEHLQIEGRKVLTYPPSEFNQRVYHKISSEIEYWKIEDILTIFKAVIDSDLIGQAKQIKKYRDWVAHRNINKPAPPNISPENTYSILSSIVEQLKRIEI